ncbi:MAG: CinA family protein, partial [Sulfurifustis sp.]
MAAELTDAELTALAAELGRALMDAGLTLATAESCTGGWVGRVVTSVSGSSSWYERGFITYSEDAKQELLGVPALTLRQHGAVSEPTARAMAEGALVHSRAHVTLAITGIAGPTGGTAHKPVGTVWFAWAAKGRTTQALRQQLDGDREAIRRQSVAIALRELLKLLRQDFQSTG